MPGALQPESTSGAGSRARSHAASQVPSHKDPPHQLAGNSLPDFAAGEEVGKKKQVYLVTLPHPHQPLSSTDVRLRLLGELTHIQPLD